MAQKHVKQSHPTPEREREAAEARAELERLAQEQGIKPFNFDEALGE